jgi:CBS domain-containing protein
MNGGLARTPATSFASQLRSARLVALEDSEAFGQVLHVVERLGSYLSLELGAKGEFGNLNKYKKSLSTLVSVLWAVEEGDAATNSLTSFERLYDLVKDARNDALHQGAFARHLTRHAIELAIVLEDALSGSMQPVVADFMVRNPVYAEAWQPVSFVRQQMLANSYSYLPVSDDSGNWQIVSDTAIAGFLGPKTSATERRKRVALALRETSDSLMLTPAEFVSEEASLDEALRLLKAAPVLLVREQGRRSLVGILTAFDLL